MNLEKGAFGRPFSWWGEGLSSVSPNVTHCGGRKEAMEVSRVVRIAPLQFE